MSRTTIGILSWAVWCAGTASSARAQSSGQHPLTVSEAVGMALARAPEVAVARAGAQEGAAAARLAEAGFHPEAFVTTTPGYSSGLPIQVAGQVPAIAGVSVRQTLYDPGRRAEALEARGRAAVLAGNSQRSEAEIAHAVILSYGRNWADENQIAGARRRLEAREATLGRISALKREGRLTDLDVERAALEVARAKQHLLDQQSEQALDQLELKRLLDWPSGQSLVLAQDPLAGLPEPLADRLTPALASDPELKALEQQADALGAAAALAGKTWRPVVEAEARYLRLANYNNFDQYFINFKPNDFAVGVSVVLPVWSGGRFAQERAASQSKLEGVQAALRARREDLEILVRRAESDLLHAESLESIAGRAARLAQADLAAAAALGDEGRGEPAENDKREISLADAQDDLVGARQALLAARARILTLTGQLPGARAPETGRSAVAQMSAP